MRRSLAFSSLFLLVLTACGTPAPVAPVSDLPELPETWSPWDNVKQGYSFGTPSDWMISDEKSKDSEIIRLSSPSDDNLEITVTPAESLEKALVDYDASTKIAYEGQPSVTVKESAPATVHNQPAVTRHEYLEAAAIDSVVTYVFYEGKLYQVRLTKGDGTLPNAELQQQIMQTFAFTGV
jgi:hypothetical protein